MEKLWIEFIHLILYKLKLRDEKRYFVIKVMDEKEVEILDDSLIQTTIL